jgi:Cytochrome c7 and related cytochrome c
MNAVSRAFPLFALVVLAMLLALVAAWAQTPPVQSPAAPSPPDQPIAFSHKKHAGELQMRCKFCHAPSRSGETLAIPQATTCMTCHATVAVTNPEIKKLTEYANDKETIPWVRVYQLPSFVTFSHKVHVDHGNTCQECHGPVTERDQIFQESDISMGGCLNCQRLKKASTDCDTCHMLPQ